MSRVGQVWESDNEGMQYVVEEGVAFSSHDVKIPYVKMLSLETGNVGYMMTGVLLACEEYLAEDGFDPSWKRVA